MTDTVTQEQASAHFHEVMVASGVLTPKTGMLAAAKTAVTGKTEFDVHPEKVDAALVRKLDADKVLGTREGRDAMGQDSLVLWSPSDIRDVAAAMGKHGVAQATAKTDVAQESHSAGHAASSVMDSLKAAMSGADVNTVLGAAAGMKNGKVVAGDSYQNGEIPTCQQLANGHASAQQEAKGTCRSG